MKSKDLKRLTKSKKGTDISSSSTSSSPNQRRSKCTPQTSSCQLRSLSGQRDIEITVQTIMGKIIPINVKSTTTVGEIKMKLYQSQGIAPENQHLVFKDQELSDIDSVRSLGLTDGSTIKLLISMMVGRGIYVKKEKVEDPVLLLLCHDNDDIYMLELYMGEDKTKPILLKAQSELSLENYTGETSSSEEIEEVIEGSGDDEESIFDSARPTSTFSTSTVFSIISNGTSKILSRPTSSNSLSSASSSLLEEFLSAATNSTSIQGARPATAISIMRLPISSPLIILPKSRPASAIITRVEVKETKKSTEKLENLDNKAADTDQIKEFISETHHAPCSFCKKKTSFSFKCKCGKIFCSLHRYSDRHSCSYDYAEAHRKILREQLSLVNGEKIKWS